MRGACTHANPLLHSFVRMDFHRLKSMSVLCAVSALSAAGCGAKTGLEAPEPETGVLEDASMLDRSLVDEPTVQDVPPRFASCRPIRYFTRLGSLTSVRPDLDSRIGSVGFVWTVDSRPAGSVTQVFSDGTDTGVLTPDTVGEYNLGVVVPAVGMSGPLRCVVTVVVDPPDPRCPGYTLAEPRIAQLPSSNSRVAFDTAFTDPVLRTGEGTGAIFSDDTAARVSVAVTSTDAGDPEDPTAWLGRVSNDVDDVTLQTLRTLGSATLIVAGRTITTRAGDPARRTTQRVLVDGGSTNELIRNALARALARGVTDPPRLDAPEARAFLVEITTVLRVSERRVVTFVAVAPEGLVDDASQTTAIRMNDIANATALGVPGESLSVRCHQVRTTQTLKADFLWLVDTSGSMDDDQQRAGRTGAQFVRELNGAGVDFRVGVMQAGTQSVNLDREVGGTRTFAWIPGDVMTSAQQIAWQVTEQVFEPGDNIKPYRLTTNRGEDEQPVGAGVLAYDEFKRREMAGEVNPNWRWRQGAVRVAFLVTDEPGSNDNDRFFNRNPGRWGASSNIAQRIATIAADYRRNNVVPFGLVPNFPGAAARCPSIANLPQCVIIAAGGAFIPIDIADAREADRAFSLAMSRVVDVIAGAGSEFVLPTVPVSSTLRARVGGSLAPRSRIDGFDYEDGSRSLIFRGARYRPMVGQDVRTAYFVWAAE